MSRRESLDALTGLRGVVALWVVAFHLRPWLALPAVLDDVAAAGYLAVDVFFVLSGFVLAYQYGQLELRMRVWLDFWWRRLARIAPLHLAILVALVTVVLARNWWGQSAYRPTSLLAQLTLTQVWSIDTASSWNEPAWSVSAEWHAYLAFPVLAALVSRVRGAWLAVALALVLVLARAWGGLDAIAGLPLCGRLFGAFAAGILLARARQLGCTLPRGSSHVAALALVVCAALRWDALVPCAGAALILALARCRGALATVLAQPRLVRLGELSYAIYLVHGAAMLGLWKFAPPDASTGVRLIAVAGYGVLVLAISVLLHRYLEVPARRQLVSRVGSLRANREQPCPVAP